METRGLWVLMVAHAGTVLPSRPWSWCPAQWDTQGPLGPTGNHMAALRST